MSKATPCIVALTAALMVWSGPLSAQNPPAQQQQPARGQQDLSEEAERIQDSIELLRELTTAPDDGIPQHLLERAEAIVVIPSLIKGGFIVGAKHGRGVVSVKTGATGAQMPMATTTTASAWSSPLFVTMTGGSIGWQIGAESVDLVLLVMNKGGVEALLEDKFTLSGNLSVSAGPIGRSADAGTNPRLDSEILAYSKSKGLFAGATFEGATLRADDDANEDFYGRELSMKDALSMPATMTQLPMVQTWKTTLATLTGRK
jgi:lipid-binding SYLF domain-containing protein